MDDGYEGLKSDEIERPRRSGPFDPEVHSEVAARIATRDRDHDTVKKSTISNVEELLVRLDDQIKRLEVQLGLLVQSIDPILTPFYPTPESSETEQDRKDQSVVAGQIEDSINKLRDLTFGVQSMIDRVDC